MFESIPTNQNNFRDMLRLLINDKLLLRSFTTDDSIELSRQSDNIKIWKNMRDEFPSPFSTKHATDWIEKYALPNMNTYFAIEYECKLVGVIYLKVHNDIRRHSAILTYWIGEDYWNIGIATKSINKITDYAFNQLDLFRIYAKVFSTNRGSIRSLQKSGFKKEGHFENAILKEDILLDQEQYAIIKYAHTPNKKI